MTQFMSHLPAKTSASHATENGCKIHCRSTVVSLPDIATALEKVLIPNVAEQIRRFYLYRERRVNPERGREMSCFSSPSLSA